MGTDSIFYFYFMCMGGFVCLYIVCYLYTWYTWRLEEGSDHLELELKMIVSQPVGAGN